MSQTIITRWNDDDWIADPYCKLPTGEMIKVLRKDEKAQTIDMLCKWPPGYVEPRHTHGGWHSVVVLKGRVIAEGKELGPGSYVYGPSNEPHGPFEWLDNCVIFSHFEGDTVHNY